MKMLLHNRYKKWGWILFVPSLLMGLAMSIYFKDWEAFPLYSDVLAVYGEELVGNRKFFQLMHVNITPTLIAFFILLGSLIIIFTKEKKEDEFISSLRLNSLLWAVLVNQVLLILFTIFVYGMPYLDVMMYNMFTLPLIFILRFYFVLFQQSRL